ncbi:phosphatidylglycerophosphatase A [Exilibacterium tricleocarpae]|uniref:Phosphatidylglycerophosphatase A n=1 Tax=Exilibacterium tricleocarpae TaxID=2591008 RepID=A0A545SPS8_9GAMM|nr:phosphatidylglycerophosphatase A [Exilibacterium tricleocarpae]TQV66954.1 phosphatidylglycerophosphatase A [Exilibacterium tricleocarpae]
MTALSFTDLLRRPLLWLAFGFGAGLSPRAPGTAGTLVAVPVYLLIQDWSPMAYAALLLLTFAAGVYLCHRSAAILGVHDHPGIVWDEMVGLWITLFLAPSGWVWLLLGFVLFRFFDIVKPWPISWLDKNVHGGLGIMVDDVLAGIFAFLCLQLLAWGWNL